MPSWAANAGVATLAAAIAAPKISFDTFAMIECIDAQKIGLHRRKFHHAFLSTMQSCIVQLHGEARRIAANIAKLPELLRKD